MANASNYVKGIESSTKNWEAEPSAVNWPYNAGILDCHLDGHVSSKLQGGLCEHQLIKIKTENLGPVEFRCCVGDNIEEEMSMISCILLVNESILSPGSRSVALLTGRDDEALICANFDESLIVEDSLIKEAEDGKMGAKTSALAKISANAQRRNQRESQRKHATQDEVNLKSWTGRRNLSPCKFELRVWASEECQVLASDRSWNTISNTEGWRYGVLSSISDWLRNRQLEELVKSQGLCENLEEIHRLPLCRQIAKLMRPRLMEKSLTETVKEILGTCVSVGCTVVGEDKDPKDLQKRIDGEVKFPKEEDEDIVPIAQPVSDMNFTFDLLPTEIYILKWMQALKVLSDVFNSCERKLYERSFVAGLPFVSELCFRELAKETLELLSFCEAMALSPRASKQLFKILNMCGTLRALTPQINCVYSGEIFSAIKEFIVWMISREAAEGTLPERKTVIQGEVAKSLMSGGAYYTLFPARGTVEQCALDGIFLSNEISDADEELLDVLFTVVEKTSTRTYDHFVSVFKDSSMNGEAYFEPTYGGIPNFGFISEFTLIKEDVRLLDCIQSDITWRRLIRSALEQSLAKLKSSMGLVMM